MKRQYNVPVHGDRLSRDHAVHGCSRQVVTRLALVFIDLYRFFPLSKLLSHGLPGLYLQAAVLFAFTLWLKVGFSNDLWLPRVEK